MQPLTFPGSAADSKHTTDQIFNRMCRAMERLMVAADDRAPTPSNRTIAQSLQSMKDMLHMAPVFHFTTADVMRVAVVCKENPVDVTLYPIPVLPFNELVIVNQHHATLLFDAESAANPGDDSGWGKGVLWRCKHVTYVHSDDGWILMCSTLELHAPDPVTWGRSLAITNANVCMAYQPDGDPDFVGSLERWAGKDPEYAEQARGLVRQIMSMALDACRYIDLPRHHLVVEEPHGWKPDTSRPKIPRAADRPRVRIVAPEDIRKVYPHHTSTGATRTVTPHARRGFTKLLSSSRFKDAKGKRIVVRPTWVGDTEWQHKRVNYRVVTRKPEEK